MSDYCDLDGKVAVVTGALGLLGPVWSSALVDAGAIVVGLDLEKGDRENNFSKLMKEYPDRVGFVTVDVTRRSTLDKALTIIKKKWGVPGILVNNAGVDQPPVAQKKGFLLADIPFEVGRKILDVNLLGAFQMMQVFGSEMVRAGTGSIVNIASHYALVSPDPSFYTHIKSEVPFLKPPMYGPSKAALLQLTRYMAVLWGKYKVRVNSISPGGVFNSQDPKFVRKYSARVPLGRMAEREDLGGPLVFLASEASSYVTGANLVVDGGFTAL